MTVADWMNLAAKRAAELGRDLTHGQLKRIAQTMTRIEASTERVDDLDVVIRLHSDPTATEAIRNVMREQNAANAARRIGVAA